MTCLITVDDILSTILYADVQGQERLWKVAFDRFSILGDEWRLIVKYGITKTCYIKFVFPLVWLLNSMTKRCESHHWTSVYENILQDPTYASRIVWQQGIRIPMSLLWSIMYPYSLCSSSRRSFINLITVIEFKMRKASLHTVLELVQASPSWWDLRHLDHQGVPPRRADKFHLVSDPQSAFLTRTKTMETGKKAAARPLCDSSISWILEPVWRAGGLAFCSWSHPNECDNLMWRSVGKSGNVVAMQTKFATAARHSSCPPLIFPSSFRGQYPRWWSTSPSCDCKLSSERAAISLFRHPRQLCLICPQTTKRRRTIGGSRGRQLIRRDIKTQKHDLLEKKRFLSSADGSSRRAFQRTSWRRSSTFSLFQIPWRRCQRRDVFKCSSYMDPSLGATSRRMPSDVTSLVTICSRTVTLRWRVWTHGVVCSPVEFFISWIRASVSHVTITASTSTQT